MRTSQKNSINIWLYFFFSAKSIADVVNLICELNRNEIFNHDQSRIADLTSKLIEYRGEFNDHLAKHIT